jgi:chromosome partitioning protein
MAKLLSLFNHKGGVSKTTTTFGLGWAMAEAGSRVLIVDGDPQCNLTGSVLGFMEPEQFEEFYLDRPMANINTAVAPVFGPAAAPLVSAEVAPTRHPRLFLLAGHIDLALNETQLSLALGTGAVLPALQNLPGALGRLLRMTAETHQVDYVLIDMSPSVGALNQCLLMGSDFFIVPTFPDFYCAQAVRSLSIVLPRWHEGVSSFRGKGIRYPIPDRPPVFLGIMSQRYRPYRDAPAASFQAWIDRIKDDVNRLLVPALRPLGMVVAEASFKAAVAADSPYNLANVADFNSLIALAQTHRKPAFALTDVEINRQGAVLENMRENRQDFEKVFNALARSVRALTV